MADTRTYIRVHDGMPDHPKVDGLSDRAFRLLVESWCWCSRHLTDGHMPAATWRKRGGPKARAELVAAGLVEPLDDNSVRFHDYLEHQRSAEEVAAAKAAKGRGGALGNHRKWHEDRGIVKPGCPYCPPAPDPDESDDDGPSDPEATGIRSDDRSLNRSENRSHPDRKTSPETTTETEIERTPSGGSSRGSVDRHPADRYARGNDDDLDHAIAGLVEQHTGRPCPPQHAAAVRRQLLDGREVERPLPYVVKAIRDNPGRFLPPAPPTPPRPEPWMATPDLGARDNGAVNARGRAAVEAAIAAARTRTTQPEEADAP